jgi:hypothetical protein
MNNTPKFTLRLVAALLVLGLGGASPAFASDDDHGNNHTENHDNGKENHGSGTDNHGNGTDNHGNGTDDRNKGSSSGGGNGAMLRAYLSGAVQPGARGEVKLQSQTRATRFEAEVKIPVPGDALSLADRTAAENATLTLTLSHAGGAPYAECDFDLAKIKSKKNSGRTAEYKIKINDRRGNLQERFGTCDIDPSTTGVQPGIPAVQAGDTAEVAIDTNGLVFLGGAF